MKKIEITHLPPGLLQPNPWNSNYVGPQNEEKLRESAAQLGIYKPVIVRELADGTLQILGGEHRTRAAVDMGLETIPVVNLGRIDDKQAKKISLADNGRYGEDDLVKLGEVLKDIGVEDAAMFLPFDDKDIASIFSLSDVAISDLELPTAGSEPADLPELKATATHQLMTFKVPLGDAEAVAGVIDKLVKLKGYGTGQDSKAAAGMALVDIVNAAKEVL